MPEIELDEMNVRDDWFNVGDEIGTRCNCTMEPWQVGFFGYLLLFVWSLTIYTSFEAEKCMVVPEAQPPIPSTTSGNQDAPVVEQAAKAINKTLDAVANGATLAKETIQKILKNQEDPDHAGHGDFERWEAEAGEPPTSESSLLQTSSARFSSRRVLRKMTAKRVLLTTSKRVLRPDKMTSKEHTVSVSTENSSKDAAALGPTSTSATGEEKVSVEQPASSPPRPPSPGVLKAAAASKNSTQPATALVNACYVHILPENAKMAGSIKPVLEPLENVYLRTIYFHFVLATFLGMLVMLQVWCCAPVSNPLYVIQVVYFLYVR